VQSLTAARLAIVTLVVKSGQASFAMIPCPRY
jgi:hypothetical protein